MRLVFLAASGLGFESIKTGLKGLNAFCDFVRMGRNCAFSLIRMCAYSLGFLLEVTLSSVLFNELTEWHGEIPRPMFL